MAFLFAPRAFAAGPAAPAALVYVTNSPSAIVSLRENVRAMDIIAPQVYAATASGKLLGSPSLEMLTIAREAGASVMPLVVNRDFDQKEIHKLLMSDTAQNALIAALITEANKRGYAGYQYDFEHIAAADRDRYTAFVRKTAPYFRGAGLQFSVALAPVHSDDRRDYAVGSWENWTGAFDYQAIGAVADFVSVMAYDDGKSPGPAASLPWVASVVEYALARIPAEKISLGVPFYAYVRDAKTGALAYSRGYPAVAPLLLGKSYIKKGWSDELAVSYVTYKKGGKTYTAWYEDERSFREKMRLVSRYDLRGFSAWALGLEDPNVWDAVLAMRAGVRGLAQSTGEGVY